MVGEPQAGTDHSRSKGKSNFVMAKEIRSGTPETLRKMNGF
jgi:hypothetical protein